MGWSQSSVCLLYCSPGCQHGWFSSGHCQWLWLKWALGTVLFLNAVLHWALHFTTPAVVNGYISHSLCFELMFCVLLCVVTSCWAELLDVFLYTSRIHLFLGLNNIYCCGFHQVSFTSSWSWYADPYLSSAIQRSSRCLWGPPPPSSAHMALCGFGFGPECNSVVSHHLDRLNETGAVSLSSQQHLLYLICHRIYTHTHTCQQTIAHTTSKKHVIRRWVWCISSRDFRSAEAENLVYSPRMRI